MPPGLIDPSATTVSPPGSITVPIASSVSSLDLTSRPPIDIRSLTTTRTLTTASCHFFTSSRAAARLSCACAGPAVSSSTIPTTAAARS